MARQCGLETTQDAAVLAPATIGRLFASCRVASESLAAEAGTDLFSHRVIRTGAVALAAASGSRSGLGIVGALFKTLRAPVLIADVLTGWGLHQSRTAVAMYASALTAVALLSALDLAGVLSAPALSWPAWLLFLVLVGLPLLGRPRTALAWVLLWLALIGARTAFRWLPAADAAK
jgi:hypothetical protein